MIAGIKDFRSQRASSWGNLNNSMAFDRMSEIEDKIEELYH